MDNEYEAPRQRKKPKVKESIIDHTYRDYSQVEVSSDDETSTTAGDDKKPSRLQPNFPAKLHAIVSNPNYQHIICWQVSLICAFLLSSFDSVAFTNVLNAASTLLAPWEKLEDRGKTLLIQ